MRDERIVSAIESVNVSEKAGQRMYSNILQKAERRKKKLSVIKAVTPVLSTAACIGIVILAVNLIQYGVKNYDTLTSGGAASANDNNEALAEQIFDLSQNDEYIYPENIPNDKSLAANGAASVEADEADGTNAEFEDIVKNEYSNPMVGAIPAEPNSNDNGYEGEQPDIALGADISADFTGTGGASFVSGGVEYGVTTNAVKTESIKEDGEGEMPGMVFESTVAPSGATSASSALLIFPEECIDVNYSYSSGKLAAIDFNYNGHYYVIHCSEPSNESTQTQFEEQLEKTNIVESEEFGADRNMYLYSFSENNGELSYKATWSAESGDYVLINDDGAGKDEVLWLWAQVLRDNGMGTIERLNETE